MYINGKKILSVVRVDETNLTINDIKYKISAADIAAVGEVQGSSNPLMVTYAYPTNTAEKMPIAVYSFKNGREDAIQSTIIPLFNSVRCDTGISYTIDNTQYNISLYASGGVVTDTTIMKAMSYRRLMILELKP